ncbi:MAG: Holliday junction branch migration protein RuvA [Bacteroidales bacterium]|nr:Holliday junction branch migration protein RuvA [Bacteroidales bacterium]
MLEYIKGEIADLTPATVVIDCNGVGYIANISLNTYSAIQGKKEVKLYLFESIREDAYVLFGFASKKERSLFILLISVSGIGGNTARMILSSMTSDELIGVIAGENVALLKSVKGIGMKTAQRVIVELKDKISNADFASAAGLVSATSVNKEVMSEAVSALNMLGFATAPSQKIVVQLLKNNPDAPVEKIIKDALKML